MAERRKRIQAHVDQGTRAPAAERWEDHEELRWTVRQWATRIGVAVKSVQIREMRTKWASISTAGRLTLNRELLELPRDLGEFVVIHELIHLLHPDARHGRVFKAYMSAYLPDWRHREKRLANASRIGFQQ